MSKKLRKIAVLFVLVLALAVQLVMPASAARLGSSVSATVPTFDVTLNGHKVDNTHSQYPLLVYRDITYMPMTYHGARWMGLTTTWSSADGLGVNQQLGSLAREYNNYDTDSKNKTTNTATVAAFKIAVNGKTINNANEKYPLLVFRGVTYFPLTWAFCVNEFGWRYSYSKENGLVIDSKVSSPAGSFYDGTSTWFYRDGSVYRLTGSEGWAKKVYTFKDFAPYYVGISAGSNGGVVLTCQSSESGITSTHWKVYLDRNGKEIDTGAVPDDAFNDGTSSWFYADGTIYRAGSDGAAAAVYTFEGYIPLGVSFASGSNGGVIAACRSSESGITSDRSFVVLSADGSAAAASSVIQNAFNDGTNTWFCIDHEIYRAEGDGCVLKLVYEAAAFTINSYTFEKDVNGNVVFKCYEDENASSANPGVITFDISGKTISER